MHPSDSTHMPEIVDGLPAIHQQQGSIAYGIIGRIHFFNLTATKGPGTGESFKHFPIQANDYILA
ncbi:MAG: hypothetical protein F4120_07720, partial [Rhodothermaceae bacterium]|nr:hypothetical protein [Rhodothermaceae bacterium]